DAGLLRAEGRVEGAPFSEATQEESGLTAKTPPLTQPQQDKQLKLPLITHPLGHLQDSFWRHPAGVWTFGSSLCKGNGSWFRRTKRLQTS
ncbi:unnamed protein product, partial [Ascophyllum nodosum]